MAVFYFDSSSIVKRYVIETGTGWVNHLVDPTTGNHIYMANITGVEVVSAITRRGGTGSIGPADAAVALRQFRTDFSHLYRIVELTSALVHQAIGLAEAHALRGYDAVQLATVLEVKAQALMLGLSLTLVSADRKLNTAANAEGLVVDDPNLHP